MPTHIRLTKYNQDFSQEIPITTDDWKRACYHLKGLRLNDEPAVEFFVEELGEWSPVYWIDAAWGYMKQTPFFEFEEVSQKGFEIAIFLEAFITTEEAEILFMPVEHGLLNDVVSIESLQAIFQQEAYVNMSFKEKLEHYVAQQEENIYKHSVESAPKTIVREVYEARLKQKQGCMASIYKTGVIILLIFFCIVQVNAQDAKVDTLTFVNTEYNIAHTTILGLIEDKTFIMDQFPLGILSKTGKYGNEIQSKGTWEIKKKVLTLSFKHHFVDSKISDTFYQLNFKIKKNQLLPFRKPEKAKFRACPKLSTEGNYKQFFDSFFKK